MVSASLFDSMAFHAGCDVTSDIPTLLGHWVFRRSLRMAVKVIRKDVEALSESAGLAMSSGAGSIPGSWVRFSHFAGGSNYGLIGPSEGLIETVSGVMPPSAGQFGHGECCKPLS